MPEVHGKGLGNQSVRDTYKKEMLEAEQQNAQAIASAQKMVAEKIQRESKAKQEVYGEVLGNMYDGDREAIQQFRDHIKKEFEAGVYATDPSMYQTRISNLNAMIENAENFYKTTYGDDTADGTGNTYRDIQIRHQRGNSVEFWEEQGLELKGDEWLDAQKRLGELQGGMYRDLQFSPDGSVMARSLNPETGEVGELVGFENLPQREIGSQNFLPDTRVATPMTLIDLAGQADVQTRLHQLQTGLLTEAGQVTMTDGTMLNVEDMNELQKMNYMSDKYYDDYVRGSVNTTTSRQFRRSIITGYEGTLTNEQKDAFINGGVEAMSETMGEAEFAAFRENTRKEWREVTRQAFLKEPEYKVSGGSGKERKAEYVQDGYVFTSILPKEAGGQTEDIRGDRLLKPMVVQTSQAFLEYTKTRGQKAGEEAPKRLNTERDEYRITGATVDPTTGDYLVRIEIPVFEEKIDPLTGKRETYETYEQRNIPVNRASRGFAMEVYGNIMNSPLEMRLKSKRASYLDRIKNRENL